MNSLITWAKYIVVNVYFEVPVITEQFPLQEAQISIALFSLTAERSGAFADAKLTEQHPWVTVLFDSCKIYLHHNRSNHSVPSMEKSAILKDGKLWHLNLQIASQQVELQDFCIRSSQASGLQQEQNLPRSASTTVRQVWERCSHWEEAISVNHSAFSHKGNFLQQSSTLWFGLSQI